MPRPWRIRFAGAKYHLTQRGNGGEKVFLCRADRGRFLEQLDKCLAKNEVKLYAYCLMSNHYHLLVETPLGNVQMFMQRLNTAYGMYFRYKHNKPGHCWQGRYGAKLVKGDDYVLRLTRYIHLNPVKIKGWTGKPLQKAIEHLNGYEWSSYRSYAGLIKPEERIDYRWLKLMGGVGGGWRRKAYRKYIESMVTRNDDEFIKEANASRYAIGDEEYREEVDDQVKEKRMEKAFQGDYIWPEDRLPGIAAIEAAVVKEFGVSCDDLHFHGQRAGVIKSIAIELCCRLSGKTQREVGEYFGYTGDGGVCKQRQRLAPILERDKELSDRVMKTTNSISKYIVQV